MAPSMSVVMITYNRCHLLRRHLPILLNDPAATEIVVVNDGSSDGSEDLLTEFARKEPRLVPIHLPNGGMDRARRAGVEAASGELILLMDDDVEPSATLVTDHLARHVGTDDRVVVGYMPVSRPSGAVLPFAVAAYADDYEQVVQRYEAADENILRDLWNGHVSMPRESFLRARDGDPVWPREAYHEDKHLGMQLRRLGLVGYFDRALIAYHRHGATHDSFRRNARQMGYGERIMHERHPELGPFDASAVGLFGLAPPVRWLVRIGDLPGAAAITAVLAQAAAASGRLGLHTAEDRLARLVRRMELRIGVRQRERARRQELLDEA